MADTLGFGLLGAGLIAPFHANSISDSKGGTLIAVCDMNKERADKVAADYGIKAYYTYDEMLNDAGIDVVNVLTPNPTCITTLSFRPPRPAST